MGQGHGHKCQGHISYDKSLFAIINKIKKSYAVLELTHSELCSEELLSSPDHQEIDALETFNSLCLLNGASIDWLVLDSYELDDRFRSKFLSCCNSQNLFPSILSIDDFGRLDTQSDVVVNPSFSQGSELYPNESRARCVQQYFLGSKYALLGQEYKLLAQLSPPRTSLRRILIFFGGVDQENYSLRALQACLCPQLQDVGIDLVLGQQSPHISYFKDFILKYQNVDLHVDTPSLAGLMIRADLAIGAIGVTALERTCLQLPSLFVSTAENQSNLAIQLKESSLNQFISLGINFSPDSLRDDILAFKNKYPLPYSPRLCDGLGCSRLASIVGSPLTLSLRNVGPEDKDLMFWWVNDQSVRESSFSRHPISFSDHSQWFDQSLILNNRYIFIADDEYGCPIGQIRFDYTSSTATALIDISIDRAFRRLGYGLKLIQLGIAQMIKILPSNTVFCAEILVSNASSTKTFLRAGFILSKHSEDFNTYVYQ